MNENQSSNYQQPAAAILRDYESKGLKIACAESLTGGLLADSLVRIPGASNVFLGSAVTYDIKAKASILGVDRGLLEREGAVHPEVARQMAARTAHLYDQPEYAGGVVGLSTTGVAGPGPDGDKPAGLVYVGIAIPGGMVDVLPDPASITLPEHTAVVMDDERAWRNMGNGWHAVAFELRLGGSREQVREGVVSHVLRIVTQLTLPVVE